jgi:hypothetical protein
VYAQKYTFSFFTGKTLFNLVLKRAVVLCLAPPAYRDESLCCKHSNTSCTTVLGIGDVDDREGSKTYGVVRLRIKLRGEKSACAPD